MNKSEQNRFDELYRKHLRALKLQGMSGKTIDAYSRAVRRIAAWFDGCPDRLEGEQLAEYFSELVASHSWSTVKLDRCGLQFFYQHVLDRDWQWVEMIRAPKVQSLPDILSVAEIEALIGAARKLHARRLRRKPPSGGGVHRLRRCWKKVKGRYLFSQSAAATRGSRVREKAASRQAPPAVMRAR